MKPSPLVAYSTLPLPVRFCRDAMGGLNISKEVQADPEEREGSVIPEDNYSRV